MPRHRAILLAATLATIIAGLLTRHYLTGPLAKYLGVALYAVMIFLLVAFTIPRSKTHHIAAIALAICFAIEFLQLTPIPANINSHMPLMRLVLGEHFSWWDLVAYAGGVALTFILFGFDRRRSDLHENVRVRH
jgi:hypothetical protein